MQRKFMPPQQVTLYYPLEGLRALVCPNRSIHVDVGFNDNLFDSKDIKGFSTGIQRVNTSIGLYDLNEELSIAGYMSIPFRLPSFCGSSDRRPSVLRGEKLDEPYLKKLVYDRAPESANRAI